AVDLADASLGQAHDLADLTERELFVIVERHDEPFALGELIDGRRELFHEILVLDERERIAKWIIGKLLLRFFPLRLGGDREILEAQQRRLAHLLLYTIVLVERHVELDGHLLDARRARELPGEAAARRFHLAAPGPHRAARPIERAQALHDLAFDAIARIN